MSLKPPAGLLIAPRSSSGYPEPVPPRVLPREKRALGDALGLTKVGVNLTTLPPGKESSMRHFHTREDELVFILEGEVVLTTDDGEQILVAGMCAGFPAGSTNGHQLVNRSDRPARYLEISNRDPEDSAEYPDVDSAYRKAADGRQLHAQERHGVLTTVRSSAAPAPAASSANATTGAPTSQSPGGGRPALHSRQPQPKSPQSCTGTRFVTYSSRVSSSIAPPAL